MKTIITTVLLMTASILTQAQSKVPVISKEETAVNAGIEKLRVAMIAGDKAGLESVLGKELYYTHSNGHIETREQFIKAISTKKSDFVKIDLVHPSVKFLLEGEIALARHILVADTNDGGVPRHIFLGIVQIWKKEKGDWKMISRSSFHVPEEDAH
ncbi:nuclear transport factor 2 family protein [Pedobacter sp. MC2016-14]|uniref:nuclear transport factor 2 family protein n=1 Tax=Pedobacter sp. MC2016-14 TaxID=2897327 RepID=UPI001E5B623C|nr:nuclear transport factor 2 family protein [Pedobacter sp. MC2016-14]MCD0488676.1 nuclear transport factor 2 family protein [Pedobacter sp. MC2016-14]